MLPDLRSFKRSFGERLQRALQERVLHYAPLMREIKVHHQQEGNRFSYETHDDSEIHRETFKVFTTPMTTRILPSPIEQEEEIGQKLDEAAKDMAGQQMRLLFNTITVSSQRVGTAFDAGGRPFDIQMYLDNLERIWLDFDALGRPILPTIVMHPDMAKALAPRFAEWERDPAFQARWQAVIARKKEEWRAREGRRKLVG